MKSIYVFLLIVVGLFTKAQQSDLINNTWYLEKLVLNNQEYYYPNTPIEGNHPIPEGKAQFLEDVFVAKICNSMGGDIVYSENNVTIKASGLTLGGCPTGYDSYENHYFGGFFGVSNSIGINLVYSYTINNTDIAKRLILINPNGDKAFYYSNKAFMSVGAIEKEKISLYPNPVKQHFTIDINDQIEQVEIYSINGQLLKTVKSKKINISDLAKGNYLVKIKTDKEIITQKIIKE
ncbi:T9SS type A sorting domain-containing protein [Epilithonimonas xixisoli]|uniref:Putative secreted protein (Por secretion system target) n=1 Tax=Epilithonimonas xixisoli TaxID=1476462 RepID=A0A4R8I5E8_9FLAO|nr:T9SS type A sorting domain-containing protein [Epilithonimonas xixisoli]TDX84133.1 putative secreted protein (Por secretion system target) [Epilithonimonas xixisoli]